MDSKGCKDTTEYLNLDGDDDDDGDTNVDGGDVGKGGVCDVGKGGVCDGGEDKGVCGDCVDGGRVVDIRQSQSLGQLPVQLQQHPHQPRGINQLLERRKTFSFPLLLLV